MHKIYNSLAFLGLKDHKKIEKDKKKFEEQI